MKKNTCDLHGDGHDGRTQQGYIQRVLLGIVLLVGKAEMQLKHIGINMDWSSEKHVNS